MPKFFQQDQIVQVNEYMKVRIILEKEVPNTPYLSVVLAAEIEETDNGIRIPQYITWLYNSTLANGKGGFGYGHYFRSDYCDNDLALQKALEDFRART